MVNSFCFDEVNSSLSYRFVNTEWTTLALFYSVIFNTCYTLSKNAPGIVCHSPIPQKSEVLFTQLINIAESGLTYIDSLFF